MTTILVLIFTPLQYPPFTKHQPIIIFFEAMPFSFSPAIGGKRLFVRQQLLFPCHKGVCLQMWMKFLDKCAYTLRLFVNQFSQKKSPTSGDKLQGANPLCEDC